MANPGNSLRFEEENKGGTRAPPFNPQKLLVVCRKAKQESRRTGGQVEYLGVSHVFHYTFNMCCVVSSSCVSRGSKSRVRAFTTASPESWKAASSSELRRVGRLR